MIARRMRDAAVTPLLAACAVTALMLSLDTQAQSPPARTVEVANAQTRSLSPSVVATGQVQSRAGADLAAGIAGLLDWVAEPGTRVKAGDVIARVDTLETRLQRAELAARQTRGQVALRQAERELQRLQASGDAVSRFQLDQAENTRDLARSDLEIADAALRQVDDRLARAETRAPFAGVISERLRREGEEVARGDLVARLFDTEHLEIRLFLPLRHVRAIQAGSTVQVQLDAQTQVPARVRAIVPVGDAVTQSFEALIDAPTLNPPLAVGRSVRVELPLAGATEALAVPRDALVVRAEGMYVFRVQEVEGKGSVAERVPVTTGIAEGDWISVHGALSDQDSVVVRGAETLQDGAAVTVIGEKQSWISNTSLSLPSRS
jgi:RND family efflux transporter MFP subunit